MEEYRSSSSLGILMSVDQIVWAANLLLDDEAWALHGSTLALTAGRFRRIL
jgi:hypothetical protein